MQAKNNLRPLPFYLQEDPAADGSRSIEQQLDDAAAEAAARGIPVRALLVRCARCGAFQWRLRVLGSALAEGRGMPEVFICTSATSACAVDRSVILLACLLPSRPRCSLR